MLPGATDPTTSQPRRHEAVPDVVHHHSETFQRAHAEKDHVARLREYDLVVRLVSLGTENRVPDLTPDDLLAGSGKLTLATGGYADRSQHLGRQPRQLGPCVDDGLLRGCRHFFLLRVGCDNVHPEHAHDRTTAALVRSSSTPFGQHRRKLLARPPL
jgi:hypothetical protein